jgi:hypothetical protein
MTSSYANQGFWALTAENIKQAARDYFAPIRDPVAFVLSTMPFSANVAQRDVRRNTEATRVRKELAASQAALEKFDYYFRDKYAFILQSVHNLQSHRWKGPRSEEDWSMLWRALQAYWNIPSWILEREEQERPREFANVLTVLGIGLRWVS